MERRVAQTLIVAYLGWHNSLDQVFEIANLEQQKVSLGRYFPQFDDSLFDGSSMFLPSLSFT